MNAENFIDAVRLAHDITYYRLGAGTPGYVGGEHAEKLYKELVVLLEQTKSPSNEGRASNEEGG